MKPDLEAIRARAAKATAGPWTACCAHNLKGCSHVMHEDGMVAEATKGKWGDDYPSLRFVDGSIDRKVEAYMEQITYGEVSDEQANANKVFIAHARQDIPALLAHIDSLERVREAAAVGHTDDDGVICGQYPQSRFPCRMCDALAAVEEK